jgi:ribonuclease P protein component
MSRAAWVRIIRPESDIHRRWEPQHEFLGPKLAATNEKNLSTPQSTKQTHARLPRPDGDARGTQRAQTPPRQGPETACDLNTAEATWLNSVARPEPRLGFRAADRLRRRAEFLRVQRMGARFQSDHFVVYTMRFHESQTVRLGTTVSRRLGNAVMRNRIKRRIRECFRLSLRLRLPAGTAVVIIGRLGAGALDMQSLMGELGNAVARLQLRLKQGHEE